MILSSRISNEWRNETVNPVFEKGYRRGPKSYRGINVLNTSYKMS
jgi:hypothetical protein